MSTSTGSRRVLVAAKAHERTFLVLVAILIGCLGGFGAVGFRLLIRSIERVAWGEFGTSVAVFESHSALWIVLVPAIGGLIVGPLVYFFAREAKGHGVPEVMEAVALRSGFIRTRIVIVKSLASALSIGCGGSVGREGPIVQIGSAIGSAVGQWFKVSGNRLRTFVGCGAAAGIAATFNAPVAGALFAVEVILSDFGVSRFSPIVISSVVATVVARHFLGDVPAFVVPPYGMEHAWELLVYIGLGILAALVGVAFIKVLYRSEDLVDRVPLPPWLLTPLGGLAVGAIGLQFPQVFGVGYDVIEEALRGDTTLEILLLLVAVKLLATSLTIAVGFSGGVFAPSLFIGAMLGGAVGVAAANAFPDAGIQPGAYALVGMGAVVAATTRAPITAILILFELTSDYELILPLMAACIIATLLAERVCPDSIYTLKLIRRGVDLQKGREVNVLRSLRVKDEMTREFARLPANETFGDLLARISQSPRAYYYVEGDDGRLVGVISLAEVSSHIPDANVLANLVLVGDIARDDVPAVTPGETLDTVMRIFDGRDREELPVVDAAGRMLGVIGRQHLLDGYNRELLKRDMASGIGTSVAAASGAGDVRLGDGHRMAEIDAPGEFIGRTLRELDARRRFGVQVVLVRRPATPASHESLEIVPSAETQVQRGDRLVVLGSEDALQRVRTL